MILQAKFSHFHTASVNETISPHSNHCSILERRKLLIRERIRERRLINTTAFRHRQKIAVKAPKDVRYGTFRSAVSAPKTHTINRHFLN